MLVETDYFRGDLDSRFKIFHELMSRKIREILLVSSPYDAWIMEEDGRLSEHIIHEYRGLNLSHPPRLNWVSTVDDALVALDRKRFDMVIVMPREGETDARMVGDTIKRKAPELPVMLLSHQGLDPADCALDPDVVMPIDGSFVWSGNTDLLLAVIKNAEDQMNVGKDTELAGIRVIIFVEDSPIYRSSLLPILYKELVRQAQSVMEEGLNEEHRLLAMRARPKILVAQCFEEAINLFKLYEPYVLGIISDVRFPRNNTLTEHAGVELLRTIKEERFDIPLLLTSSEPQNKKKAAEIPAAFVDKNSPSLYTEVRSFFQEFLGFGDFVFKMPGVGDVGRASNLRSMEKLMAEAPEESFTYHTNKNDISRWLFARSEIELASRVRPIRDEDFPDVESHRQYLVSLIHGRRMRRQKGVVVNFEPREFDGDTEFWKIGTGSLGGKARGLAFISSFLQRWTDIIKKYEDVDIFVPQTLVITTDGFDDFVEQNELKALSKANLPDEEIAARFLDSQIPIWVRENLREYLMHVTYPLAVRSSSLLEDAQYRAYAGLYKTYMLANDAEDLDARLNQVLCAVKLVYASTYFKGPKAFSRRVGHRTEEEKMAVILQRVVGHQYGNHLYPAISGVAQSHNYYPFSKMKPEEGIATIGLGLGRIVMEGERALRFSPQYPEILPQRSTVDDVLKNSQRYFYALRLNSNCPSLGINEEVTLARREVTDAVEETPVKMLASTYIESEHRLRDTAMIPGPKVLTFASILKYKTFPLAGILSDVLALGVEGMGTQVELEFSVNLSENEGEKPHFAILQMRPMTAREELMKVEIDESEQDGAFCVSSQALGNGVKLDMSDIVFVKPDAFDPGATPDIAREISQINNEMMEAGRRYLLIGPGRWGSADRWLGIPVTWPDICGVGAMVETAHPELKAEPSQGSHFFHNITTLGINYISVLEEKGDWLDWDRLIELPREREYKYVAHVRLEQPLVVKVDGRSFRCVMNFGNDENAEVASA